jgi:uncharacterized protein YndB with AHSA1/START domain
MTRIVNRIRIGRSIEEVFDYLTTPANWPDWHPASLSVSGRVDHSLSIGEEVVEIFKAAGRAGRATWRVTGRDAPVLWQIETETPEATARITYRFAAEAGATLFEREIVYAFKRLPLVLLDPLIFRRRMARQSRIALDRVKSILEKMPLEKTLGR